MSSPCTIKISSPPRSLTPGASVTFTPTEVVITHSWGLQPSTALIEWAPSALPGPLVAGSAVEIDLGGYAFYGMTDNFVTRTAADGFSVLQEFQDNRQFLMWDVIYAKFNIPDNRYINGSYKQRFCHLLPADYDANAYTWTDAPYTARQILGFIFGSKTVASPWIWAVHTLMDNPVYNLDYYEGQKLGQCLVDISEKLGLVFTLSGGPYSLIWALKGTGAVPGFPAGSDARRSGSALSGNPNRIRVIGDRNSYQIFNCSLVPDWLSAWQQFWDFGAFINDIFLNEKLDAPMLAGATGAMISAGTAYAAIPNDLDHVVGYALAGARARLLTVGQYANLRDARKSNSGAQFRDTRRFQGRSRLQLPVALYLAQILFRAFKLPDNFTFKAYNGELISRFGFDLDAKPIVDVTHDPTTGNLFPAVDAQGNDQVPTSVSNGYAIVRGYQVGQDAFGTLNPDYFDYQNWISAQLLWQYAAFQMDDSGEGDQFVLFDQPVINSGDLITQAMNALPDGRPRAQLSANPTFTVPPVKAVITVQGEKFSYVGGTGTRDDVANISGLSGQFLILKPGGQPVEQTFADGMLASAKAQQYASLLLNGQMFYAAGGYSLSGADDGVDLSSAVDRVTLRWNATTGLAKEVDWSKERSRNVSIGPLGVPTLMLEPEREFDRKAALDPLFPGQEQLRTESRQLRLTAAMLRANPQMQQALVNTFHLLMGLDAPPQTVLTDSATYDNASNLPVGTPLYRLPAATVCLTPSDNTATALPHPTAHFVGVTTMDGQSAGGGVRVTASGAGGVVQARVMGPVAAGDSVGLATYCRTYLEASPATVVGTALETVGTTGVMLIRVRVQGASAVAAGSWRGLWQQGLVYNMKDEVQFGTGTSAGTYVSTLNNNLNAPDSGIGWVAKSSVATWF